LIFEMTSACRCTFEGETNTAIRDIADGHAGRETTSVNHRVVESANIGV